ncbi:Hypothetical predicted protein [Paramuricea clavata]|uniref:DUF1758 domain-containing protein n=1 Tax=Paramuricea clavata TaxID=317549 RepID=A0A6S7JE59_PARCT|nr:Hypothetical predicted protein [Paramuricea clavata]
MPIMTNRRTNDSLRDHDMIEQSSQPKREAESNLELWRALRDQRERETPMRTNQRINTSLIGPQRLLETYYTWLDDQHRRSTLEALRHWLLVYSRHKVQAEEDVEGVIKNDQERRPNRCNNTYTSAGNNRKTTSICFKRNKKHYISNCYRFKSMSLKVRWEFVPEKNLCFKCLNSGHQSVKCDKDETSPISECHSRYHPLLHRHQPKAIGKDNVEQSTTTEQQNEEQREIHNDLSKTNLPPPTSMSNHVTDNGSQFIALRTVPVVLVNGNQRIVANAFLDEGSTASFVREDIAHKLKLQGAPEQLHVSTLTGKTTFNSTRVQINVESLDSKFSSRVDAWNKDSVTPRLHVIDWNKQKSQWPHLRHLEFPHVPRNRVVHILIGINAIEFHSPLEEIPSLHGEPVARRTPLGWTCVGPCQRNIALSEVRSHYAFHIAMKEDEGDNLDCTLQRVWDLESIALVPRREETSTPDDLEAEKKVANSLRYVNCRYEVGIPWKKNEAQLENNYNLAYKRLETLEQSLKRRPNCSRKYRDTRKTLPTIKALGVTWEARNDLLTFQYAAPSIPDQLTKRVVTSFAAKIFDPLQILCPFTIQAKILLQKAWGLTWDEKLPDDLSKSWKQCFERLTQLRALKLGRCLRQDRSVDSQSVHTFASTQAYAAVSYIQNICLDETVSVVFIAAKSRVAPLKN